MNIDLTKLVTNLENKLIIDISVDFDESKLEKENIRKLDNVFFKGEITKLCDENFQISGTLSGTMVLPDDITGEDVFQKFSTSLEEEFGDIVADGDDILKIVNNKLDISDYLWQNILLEIPLKIVNKKNENLIIKGNGWRLITEEELQKEKKSPFGCLDNYLGKE